jgi:hypothetical protein
LAERVEKRNRWPFFRDTPAGQARLGDDSQATLWKAVERCWSGYSGKDSRPYPGENQDQVGCCVGCGTKHAADATQAVEICLRGEAEAWKPLCIEAIYATGRIDVGNGEIGSGDGSLGAWSAEACTKFGFAPMEKIGGDDLTKFSPQRARQWGARSGGVPKAVKDIMAQHKMGAAAKVTTWAECKRALSQGYAVFVCSNIGFEGRKDQDGFISPRGTWPHCMAILGYQTGSKEGGFILNSWGPSAHPGARGVGDPPDGWGFWATGNTINRMLGQGDSYALSKFDGFPARKIDWWAGVPVKERFLAINRRPSLNLAYSP